MSTAYQRPSSLQLPWVDDQSEDQLFRKVLRGVFVAVFILSLIIPFISLPEITREEKEALPPQLAKILLEKKPVVKPPKPKPKPKKEIKDEPKPKEKAPKKVVKPKPIKIQKARERAKKSGVLQFQDDLMAMRDSFDLGDLKDTAVTRSQGSAKRVKRDLLSAKASTKSSGIKTSKLSQDTQGQALAGRKTTHVDGPKVAGKDLSKAVAKQRLTKGRSDEDVRRIMERHKDAIFAIYNRVLRKDPSLEGKITFKIVIESDGSVSSVVVANSDFSHKTLERKIKARIRLINFGAKQAAVTTLKYSFNFLPY